jgi:uncharacterized protein (TIGR03067 family)
MKWRIILVAGLAFTVSSCGGGGTRQDALEGTWVAVSADKDPAMEKGPSTEKLAKVQMTFKGSGFTMNVEDKTLTEGTFSFGPSASPNEITISTAKKSILGIYKLDGDELTICLLMRGDKVQRPQDFAVPPGSGCMLFVLKRQSP